MKGMILCLYQAPITFGFIDLAGILLFSFRDMVQTMYFIAVSF